jgi:Uma2 family endonuclease
MRMSQPAPHRSTLNDLLAIPEGERFHELLQGALIEKAEPSGEHGNAQAAVAGAIVPPFQRRQGGRSPGGWWIATEVEVLLSTGDLVRPDVLGWRRETAPVRPSGVPVSVRPDWVCEVVSPGNAKDDTVKKLRVYHLASIPHYWLVDPRDGTLTVMRWSADGYVTLLRAESHETVRPEPFQAIELNVGVLFGDEPPDLESP